MNIIAVGTSRLIDKSCKRADAKRSFLYRKKIPVEYLGNLRVLKDAVKQQLVRYLLWKAGLLSGLGKPSSSARSNCAYELELRSGDFRES
jgi:hypothetical protein